MKGFILFIFLMHVLFVSMVLANEHNDALSRITEQQEQNILSKYEIVSYPILEQYCLNLARVMKFDQIEQCYFIKSDHINAYVLANGHVYFTTGIMNQIKNKHQWATILAHENAHLELNHYLKTLEKYQNPGIFFPKSKIKKMHKSHEKEADEWSRNKLIQYGFDADQIYFFIQRVIKLKGNKKTYSHHKPSKRFKINTSSEIMDKQLIDFISEIE